MMVRSIAFAFLAAVQAVASHASEASPPDRPVASTPPAYVSAFSDYQPWREPKIAPWRGVNDEVGRIGGHAGYLRDASKAPAMPKPSAPVTSPRDGKR
jgi:hypothetical protein